MRAGDNSVVATTTVAYDRYGDPIRVDGPLAGTGDTVASRYNRMRESVGQIAAAPAIDGSGIRRATRITRDGAGRVSSVDFGTVGGLDDAAWSAFSTTQSITSQYDPKGRPSATVTQGGSVSQLTNYTYDDDDRLRCTAGRSGGTSGDACTVLNGGSSSDDVRERVYGGDGQIASGKQNGVLIASYGYTTNGQIANVTDANSNVTSFQYDSYDRPLRTTYADQSYEYINRNGYGDVTSLRQRDASSISYGQDALGQVTAITLPAGGSNSNISMGYDLLGRVTSASNGNGQAPWTNTTAMVYDALGRMKSETTNPGGIGARPTSYEYDAAGNRTKITWSDGFFAAYEYRPDGLLQRIRENGGTVLAEYGYDTLGRRIALSRGNGTSSTYGYDGLSRLTGLTHDLIGTAADITYGTTVDPLSRVKIQTRSNDSYAWTGQIAADRGYTPNTLNQYVQVGTGALGYDGRGNLTSDANGGITYNYDAVGHLVASSTGARLAYDALGRLAFSAVNEAGVTRFGYAGGQMIAEYDASGNIVRRHIPSTGNDDPIVSYGSQGRIWLYADERNSVVATADDGGNASQIMSYDDFGIPGGVYESRFQYTGQAWLPELGMAYYKARIYSPTLGRFMQPDPIGIAGGPNLYNYVGSDPVNNTDPTGLIRFTWQQCTTIPGYSYGSGLDTVVGATTQQCTNMGFDIPDFNPGLAPGGGGGGVASPAAPQDKPPEIVITARRISRTTAKTYNRVSNLLSSIVNYFSFRPSPLCCFTAGTLVSTPTGLKTIESLKVGDLVVSRSDKTGETSAKPITSITPAHQRRIWTVAVSYGGKDGHRINERYETTDDHPWRTADGKWVTSSTLKHGQALARENGTAIVVAVVDTKATKLTYNLEVADFHTYFVGTAEAWVHNSCREFALFPTKPGQIQHIFQNRPGKYLDNPSNRELILSALHSEYYTLTDRFGTKFYNMPNNDGSSTYVQVMSNGIIKNAGYNW